MEIKKTIKEFKEKEEDKYFNRYITSKVKEDEDYHKVIYFQNEKVYLCYTTETLEEAILKRKMKNAPK